MMFFNIEKTINIERIKRILTELEDNLYVEKADIQSYKYKACGYDGYKYTDESTENWNTFNKGDHWGGRDDHFWFKTKITIPKSYEEKPVVYQITTGREGGWDVINPQFLVYINGIAVQGADLNHREVLLTEKAVAGEEFDIALYAYTGMIEGPLELNTNIAVLDKASEKLYYDILVPVEVAELLDDNDKRRYDIVNYLTEAINKIDLRIQGSESYYTSIKEASDYLEKEFYGKYCGHEDIIEICVGHTHIDVAWLWTVAQTREKAARSFSTVLNLMKQYPEYIFMSSQPQLYQFVKEDQPEIYEKIKAMVAGGRWEPEGAMWLEADCNLTSGESLVRQIIHGKKFFKDEFGIDSKILWLPDVFGYSSALPQILKKTGVDYFMTTKIGWNEYNKLPYDTFMWEGMDGTEVLTHFITTTQYKKDGEINQNTGYNGMINASDVMGCWQRYQQKDMNGEVLNCFGFGDGGGGPTKHMLESARRFAKGIPGAPKVKVGKSLDYFRKLDKTVRNSKKLPRWVGELYLETHRGTYTSMAKNKKFNRKSEFLNLGAEMLSVLNTVTSHGEYPVKELKECWNTTLLNQFHDIIPGSSIKEVYEVSTKEYLHINGVAKNIIDRAAAQIASNIDLKETSVVVFNQLGFERSDIVEFEMPKGFTEVEVYDERKLVVSQRTGDNKIIFFAQAVPAIGYKCFTIKNVESKVKASSSLKISTKEFENKFFNIKLDENANFVSIYDKINEREVIKNGQKANVLQAFEDKPLDFDNWNINIYYQEKMWEVNDIQNIEILEKGPVRSTIKIERKFLNSTIIQKIHLYEEMERIDFDTFVDWKEKHILLKAAFPVDVHAEKATYEIQYGNIERPTHWNTSWDYAKFEVVGHKWADISEDKYGVSLLNDCKYGYDIKDSVMRLSLLKSGVYPNPEADKEEHEFIYSLYPHSGNWKEASVTKTAYSLNSPFNVKLEGAHEGKLLRSMSLFNLDKENVIIEVVKKAEDSDDIIIRVYEYMNRRTKVDCNCFGDFKAVWECDMLENNQELLETQNNNFSFTIKPYEIKTFKLEIK